MGDIRMTDEAAAKVVKRFTKAAEELDGARNDIPSMRQSMETGAGEFSGALSSHAHGFEISWRQFFDQCGDSARIIAGNTNQLKVDLDRIDSDHSPAGN